MASADLVLQEYLTRSRENSVRSSSPRSIGWRNELMLFCLLYYYID
jgi:hypothetical protein